MGLPLAVVYRNLAHLYGAGIPWPAAIDTATDEKDPRWARARAEVAGGRSVYEALRPIVPPVDLAGIRAGETSGRMESILNALADAHDEDARQRRERSKALVYPVVLAHVAALLMATPDLVDGRVGPAVLWALAMLVPVYGYFFVARAVRRAAERDPAAAPSPWSTFFRSGASVEEADARSLTALGWLSDAGVPPLEAIPLAMHAGAGGRAAEDLGRSLEAARAGRPLAEGWLRLPEAFRSSLATGEHSGRLADACSHAARALREIAATRRARYLAFLRPISILVVGAIVGARVIAFWSGYYSAFGRLGL